MTDHVVILGGAGLIGQAISLAAASVGYHVVVADFDESRAEDISRQIVKGGHQSSFACCDVSSPESISMLISSLVERNGRINAVVNSTYLKGKRYGAKLPDVSVADFCETVSLQLGSLFSVYQAFSQYFSCVGGGSIVTIGSIYGSIAPRFSIYEGTDMTTPVEYAATKSALRQLNKYFAQYYKKQSVRCNLVSPGGIYDHQPDTFTSAYGKYAGAKGMLNPEDIVAAVIYFISSSAQFVTGQEIFVDDGFSL